MAQCLGEIYQFQSNVDRSIAEQIVSTYLRIDEVTGEVCKRGLYAQADDDDFCRHVSNIEEALRSSGDLHAQLFEELGEYLIERLDEKFLNKEMNFEILFPGKSPSIIATSPRRSSSLHGEKEDGTWKLKKTKSSFLRPNARLSPRGGERKIFKLTELMMRSFPKSFEDFEKYGRDKARQIAYLALRFSNAGKSIIAHIDGRLDKGSSPAKDLYALRYRIATGELEAGEVNQKLTKQIFDEKAVKEEMQRLEELAKKEVKLRFWAVEIGEKIKWTEQIISSSGKLGGIEKVIELMVKQQCARRFTDPIRAEIAHTGIIKRKKGTEVDGHLYEVTVETRDNPPLPIAAFVLEVGVDLKEGQQSILTLHPCQLQFTDSGAAIGLRELVVDILRERDQRKGQDSSSPRRRSSSRSSSGSNSPRRDGGRTSPRRRSPRRPRMLTLTRSSRGDKRTSSSEPVAINNATSPHKQDEAATEQAND